MRACFAILACFIAATLVRAENHVTWEITPPVCGPGQPFRLQVRIESDDILGPSNQVGREIKPPRGMVLRFSGQVFRANATEATLNFSGVAPEEEGTYVLPAFNVRFPSQIVLVPAINLIVSNKTGYRKEGRARAELVLPERTFYVGEKIAGGVVMRGSEQETVTGSFGLECEAEGFTFQTEGSSFTQPLQDGLGLMKPFDLTPIRAGQGEFSLSGIMLVNTGDRISSLNISGRDRPFNFRRKLTVEHVPETGRPADWGGSIGKLEVTPPDLSNRFPEVGEPIKLKLTLVGEGNLERIIAPEIPGTDNWDIALASELRQRRSEGRRTFIYTLVPRLPGDLKTPAIRFPTFNPDSKKFETVEFASVAVKVSGNAPAKVELVTIDPSAKVGTPAAKMVTGLLTPTVAAGVKGVAKIEPLAASQPFWLSNTGALVALLLATAVISVVGYFAAHPEFLIRRQARSNLRRARAAAQDAYRRQDYAAYARAMTQGLRTGAAPLLKAEPLALTQSDILRALPTASPTLIEAIFLAADGEKYGAKDARQTIAEDAQLQAMLNTLEAQL
ncbi:MAG: BatD family protein [Opitutales bacterium]|nr:BatD family protein [Opitutales bacterium]